jgi:stearoyl-CoA desaturase (delta-9 desaturase)
VILPAARDENRIDWFRCLPFFAMHALCFGVIIVGASAAAVWTAVALYAIRMFAITAFYHRYFSHRAFRVSRPVQFLMAFLGTTAAQRGPIWWAAHHRHHHAHSDREGDMHSPRREGLWWSHMGWFMTPAGFRTKTRLVKDWLEYPEIRFIDRFDWIGPALLGVGLYVFGGWQMFAWGFGISTVALYHGTYTINSVAHRFGARRYATRDDSRNNLLLALLTLGEGWHNNHHHYPSAARQGFFWWEIDLTYYALRALAAVGIVRNLRPVTERARTRNLVKGAAG